MPISYQLPPSVCVFAASTSAAAACCGDCAPYIDVAVRVIFGAAPAAWAIPMSATAAPAAIHCFFIPWIPLFSPGETMHAMRRRSPSATLRRDPSGCAARRPSASAFPSRARAAHHGAPLHRIAAMHSEFDPDDNFAHAFGERTDLDDEAALEAVIWQLLLLINPGDEDAAAMQFAAWQEGAGGTDDVDVGMEALREAIDWKSGFHVDDGDARGLVESLDELAARFDLRIDWGVEDPTDDDFLDEAESAVLLETAFDRLREHHYTLWLRDAGPDLHAGWMTHSRDDEVMRAIAGALGMHVRPAGA